MIDTHFFTFLIINSQSGFPVGNPLRIVFWLFFYFLCLYGHCGPSDMLTQLFGIMPNFFLDLFWVSCWFPSTQHLPLQSSQYSLLLLKIEIAILFLLGLIKAFFVILLTSYKYIIIFFCQIVNRLCLFSKIKFKQKKLPRLSRKLSKFLITCLLKKQVGANLNTHGLLTTKWKQACTPYQEISPS